MQPSSVNLMKACWLVLCIIQPYQTQAQGSYSSYYNPNSYIPYPTYHSVQRYSEGKYREPTIPKPPEYVIEKHYGHNQFQHPWTVNNYAASQEKYTRNSLERPQGLQKQSIEVLPNEREDRNDFSKYAESEKEWRNQELMEKMHMLDKFLSEDSKDTGIDMNTIDSDETISEEAKRVVRQVRKQKPGFFWTLARVTFETFNETRSAIKQISDIINNNVLPDSATSASLTATAATTVSPVQTNTTGPTTMAPTTTTTEAEYVLTRSGLQSLIRRNILGLARLFNIEWRDAINQSEANTREFRKELGNQVGTYLQDNPKAF